MTILIESYGRLPTVVEGYAKPFEFQFRLHHDEPDNVNYELLGSYDISLYLVNPGSKRSFVGHGYISNTTPLVKRIRSRIDSNQTPTWNIHIDSSSEVVALIDSARRLSSTEPVQFQLEWGLLVQRWEETPQGPSRRAEPSRERVMQRTEGGSSTPLISVPIQEWTKTTERYGFPQRRFLELIFPLVDKVRWQQAADDLAQADHDFDLRNDKQAMDYCEQALENVLGQQIVIATNEQKAKEEIANLLADWGVSDQRKQEMLANVIHSSIVYARRGKHRANAVGHPEFDPNSGDAELALLMTKALLGYISKQRAK